MPTRHEVKALVDVQREMAAEHSASAGEARQRCRVMPRDAERSREEPRGAERAAEHKRSTAGAKEENNRR